MISGGTIVTASDMSKTDLCISEARSHGRKQYQEAKALVTIIRPAVKLTHKGAMLVLNAAVEAAEAMGVQQCIAVVDEGCNLLAFMRMDGSRVLSIESATRKAMTAATTGQPTGGISPEKPCCWRKRHPAGSPTCWEACRYLPTATSSAASVSVRARASRIWKLPRPPWQPWRITSTGRGLHDGSS
jgi:hypothetical protein